MRTASIIVHGGAGDLEEAAVPDHVAGCRAAARAGGAILAQGGSALDAVVAAVRVLEDDPRFNAGRGACLTRDGTIELDAAVMSGEGLRAGAVAALPPFKNPIDIARALLDRGEHVLLAAEGAAAFARESGFSPCSREDLLTEQALARWKGMRGARRVEAGSPGGTVGAVACDAAGHVAAATSTGGTAGKRSGRVGDTPVLGAGTYADDAGGAASATGKGEDILRITLTASVVARLREGASAPEACAKALDDLARIDGSAGLIAVDRWGRVAEARNTRVMPWAAIASGVESAGA